MRHNQIFPINQKCFKASLIIDLQINIFQILFYKSKKHNIKH